MPILSFVELSKILKSIDSTFMEDDFVSCYYMFDKEEKGYITYDDFREELGKPPEKYPR